MISHNLAVYTLSDQFRLRIAVHMRQHLRQRWLAGETKLILLALITQLSNEICPEVKLCDFNVFFALITDMKTVLRYHLRFPRNRHIYSGKRLQSAGL